MMNLEIVKEVFAEALTLDEASRGAFLDSKLARDPATRAEVEALLDAHTRRSVLGEDASPSAVDRVGPFRLHEIIGEGGFGVVYRATQDAPAARTVAVKLLHPFVNSGSLAARFAGEQHALARLDHPGIARLLECGVTTNGGGGGGVPRPWFAMELVEGERIDRFVKRRTIGAKDAALLMAGVAEAVDHAHQRGIIHRDLKPSNILVVETPEGPRAKVIDFGIAKALGDDGRSMTLTGGDRPAIVIGTPAYMSPEQARDTRDADVRSDVFALGAVLFELLSGRTPIPAEKFADTGTRTIAEVIGSTPIPPVTRVAPLPDRVIGALEPVLVKALAVDRGERYTTAGAFAADLRAAAAGVPTSVGSPTIAARLRRFTRRHPLLTAAGVLLAVSLLGVAAGASYGLVQARRERDGAQASAKQADTSREFLQDILTGIDPDLAQGRDTSVLRERVERAATRLDEGVLDDQPLAEADLRSVIGMAYLNLGDTVAAERLFRVGLERLTKSIGPSHLNTLNLRNGWNTARERLAETSAANDELLRDTTATLHAIEATPIPRDPERADYRRRLIGDALLGIASRLMALGRHADALATLDRIDALGITKHEVHLAALDYRAEIASLQGDPAKAAAINRRGLELAEKIGTAGAIVKHVANQGAYLEESGDPVAALPFKQRAVGECKRIFSADDDRTATALLNLGVTLSQLDRDDEANAALDEALVMLRRRHAGEDHPLLATAISHRSMRCAMGGELERAETLAREALSMRERLEPGDGMNVASSLAGLARILIDQRKNAEALSYSGRALEMGRRVQPGDHPWHTRTMSYHALSLIAAGKREEAEVLLGESIAMSRRLFPGGHMDQFNPLLWRASCLGKLGHAEEGKKLLAEARALRESLGIPAPTEGDPVDTIMDQLNRASPSP